MRTSGLIISFILFTGCGTVGSDHVTQHFAEINDSLESLNLSQVEPDSLKMLIPCEAADQQARSLDIAAHHLKERIENMKDVAGQWPSHATHVSDSLYQSEGEGPALYADMQRFVHLASASCVADSSRGRIAQAANGLLEEDLAQWHERRFYHMPLAAFIAVLSKMQLDLSRIQLVAMRDLLAQCEGQR